MLGKRSRPAAIGKPNSAAVRTGIIDHPTSPCTPMTPYAHVGGVGLGIVVALSGSAVNSAGGEVVAKSAVGGGQLMGRSEPIPMSSPSPRNLESLEKYTYVTCRKLVTTVYYDDGEISTRFCGFRASSDFLSSCVLCQEPLRGKDIFMYRGEKAFCSAECRQGQIAMDERKEQYRPEATRSAAADRASTISPYSGSGRTGGIFSTGILAA